MTKLIDWILRVGLLNGIAFALTAAEISAQTAAGKPAARATLNRFAAIGFIGGPGSGSGGGIEYERIIGNTGRLSLAIPVCLSRSNDHDGRAVPENRGARDFELLYMAPGLKYHPFGTVKRLDLGIGLELAAGRLFVRQMPARVNIGSEPLHEYTSVFCAPRLNLSLNTCLGKHLLAGAFAAAGPIVAGNPGRMANGSAVSTAFIQAGLRIGACF